MLMNELIESDTTVPTGIDIVVRAGAALSVFAPLATHTDGLAPTRWRPCLD